MAVETVFAPSTHDATPTSRKEPQLVPVCCLCGLIRDETGAASLDRECWVTQRTYRKAHGGIPANSILTHTYCPNCFPQVMDRIRAA